MNANVARQLAEKKNADMVTPILDFIKKTAEAGGFEVWIYTDINTIAREELERLGYKVSQPVFDPREQGSQIKITW